MTVMTSSRANDILVQEAVAKRQDASDQAGAIEALKAELAALRARIEPLEAALAAR